MSKRFPAYPKKKHASNQARIRYGGRDYYLGVFGSDASRREYARLAAEFAAGKQHSSPRTAIPATRETTVGEVIAAWHVHAAERYDKASMNKYASVLVILDRLHSHTLARDFDSQALRAVRKAMVAGSWLKPEEIEERRKRNKPIGWSRNMVNRSVTRIRTVWRWAEDEAGLVPRGSWVHLCSMKNLTKLDAVRQTKPRKPVPWEHVLDILDVVPPAVAVMIEVQWWTGMRPSEVCRMRAGAVSKEDNGDWLYWLDGHKGDWRDNADEQQAVVIGPEAQRVLGPWMESCKNRGPDAALFPPSRKRLNDAYTVAAYNRTVTRACEVAGVPHWTPYQIRHSTKRRITRAQGLDAARAVLRQKSIQATDGYAADRDLDLARDAMRKLG